MLCICTLSCSDLHEQARREEAYLAWGVLVGGWWFCWGRWWFMVKLLVRGVSNGGGC
jgi:hypothetical protein